MKKPLNYRLQMYRALVEKMDVSKYDVATEPVASII